MATISEINWTRDEATGDLVAGDYRLVKKSGYWSVFNGQPEPLKRRLTKDAAQRFVAELLAAKTEPAVEVDSYHAFLAGLLAGGWDAAQITGDVAQPDGLVDYLTGHGLEKAEQWIIRALDAGDLPDVEPRVVEEPAAAPAVKPAVKAGNASDPVSVKPAKEKAKDVQALADELVWKAGQNAWNRGDLPDLLREFGLKDDDLNDRIREKALESFQARYRRNLNAEKLTWTGPTEGASVTGADTHTWVTECGMLRIVRVGGADPRFAVIVKIVAKAAKEKEIANDLKNLREALERAEAWHAGQMDLTSVKSNRERILAEAVELGLHKRPAAQNYNPETEEAEMHVTEKQARGLLTAMGVPGVDDWSIKKLTTAMADIAAATDGADLPEDADLRKLYKKIRQANDASTKISVGEVSAEKSKPGKDKKSAAEKAKPGSMVKAGKNGQHGGRLGVVIELLKVASVKNPVSREDIYRELCQKFPEEKKRKPTEMGYYVSKAKAAGVGVSGDKDGYWGS